MKTGGDALSCIFYTQRLLEMAAIALIAFFLRKSRFPRVRRVENAMRRLASGRWAYVACGLFAFLFSCFLLLVLWLPQPGVHDEFSYLLQADTFAHGRLANSPHPLWKHFETFHIIQQPTYASKYPPAQGLFLALGKIINQPILGVWLSTAMAGLAIFWMLSGIFSRGWALTGAVLSLFNPQILLWNWSYWGGSVPLLGGALALGGFWRLRQTPEPYPSALMGLGAGLLCLSRPYEGFILSALLGLGVIVISARRQWGCKVWLQRFALPFFCLVFPFLLFQACYNHRITGDSRKMPYMIYEEAYSRTPLFIWRSEPGGQINYRNPQMARFYAEWVNPVYESQRTITGFMKATFKKIGDFSKLMWDGTMLLCLVPALWEWRRNEAYRWATVFLLVGVAFTFIGPVWVQPHYFAPFFPLVIVFATVGFQHMRTWRLNGNWGLGISRLLILFLCVSSIGRFVAAQQDAQASYKAWQYGRAALDAKLRSDGNKHLVFVRYSPDHDVHQEWVWNGADLDSAPVVWALDRGPEGNRPLLEYFRDRKLTTVVASRGNWHASEHKPGTDLHH